MPTMQSFFQSKQSLEKGTVITLLWRPEGVLEILLRESDEGLDYSRVCTSLHTAAWSFAAWSCHCRLTLKHSPVAYTNVHPLVCMCPSACLGIIVLAVVGCSIEVSWFNL